MNKTTLTDEEMREFIQLSKIKRSAEQQKRYLKLRHIALEVAKNVDENKAMMSAEARMA